MKRPGDLGLTPRIGVASDAFFPFPDCVELAAEAGVTVIQPEDPSTTKEEHRRVQRLGLAMYTTGVRHFRH